MSMNSKHHCISLVFIGGLVVFPHATSPAGESASPPATDRRSQQVTNIWEYIVYRSPKPQKEEDGGPIFEIRSGTQWGEVSRGLRVDILNIAQGFRFFKTNSITARLHRADGEVIEPT